MACRGRGSIFSISLGLLLFITSHSYCTTLTRLKALDDIQKSSMNSQRQEESKGHQHHGRLLIGQNSDQDAKHNADNSTHGLTDVESDYQADMGWWQSRQDGKEDGLKPDIEAIQQVLKLDPKVECTGDSMKLLVQDAISTPASLLFVDRGHLSPLSLSKLPSSCGYTIRSSQRDLILSAPYDGCFVTLEEDNYVLPLRWWGLPVRMTCPLMRHAAYSPPMVTCHAEGMVVKTDWTNAVSQMKVNVNGIWEPLLKILQKCLFGIVEHPEGVVLSVHYSPCLEKKDGLYTLGLAAEGETRISCPQLSPVQPPYPKDPPKRPDQQTEMPMNWLYPTYLFPQKPQIPDTPVQPPKTPEFPYSPSQSFVHPFFEKPGPPTPQQIPKPKPPAVEKPQVPVKPPVIEPPPKYNPPLPSKPVDPPQKPVQPQTDQSGGQELTELYKMFCFEFSQEPELQQTCLQSLPENPGVPEKLRGDVFQPYYLYYPQQPLKPPGVPQTQQPGTTQDPVYQPYYPISPQPKPDPKPEEDDKKPKPEATNGHFYQPFYPVYPQPKPAKKPDVPQKPKPEPQIPVYKPSLPVYPQPKPEPEIPAYKPSLPVYPQPEPEIPIYKPSLPVYPQPEPEIPIYKPSLPVYPQPKPEPQVPVYQPSFPVYPQPKPEPQVPVYQPSIPVYPQPKPAPKPELPPKPMPEGPPSQPNQPLYPTYPQKPVPKPQVPQPVYPVYPQPKPAQKPEFPQKPIPEPTPDYTYRPVYPKYPQPKPEVNPGYIYQPFYPVYPQPKPGPKPQPPKPEIPPDQIPQKPEVKLPQKPTQPQQPEFPPDQMYKPYYPYIYPKPKPDVKPVIPEKQVPSLPYPQPKPEEKLPPKPALPRPDATTNQWHQQLCLYSQSQQANKPSGENMERLFYGPCYPYMPGIETPKQSPQMSVIKLPHGYPPSMEYNFQQPYYTTIPSATTIQTDSNLGETTPPFYCPHACPTGFMNCCIQIAFHQHLHIFPAGYEGKDAASVYPGAPVFSTVSYAELGNGLEFPFLPETMQVSGPGMSPQISTQLPTGVDTKPQSQPLGGNPATPPENDPSNTANSPMFYPYFPKDQLYPYWPYPPQNTEMHHSVPPVFGDSPMSWNSGGEPLVHFTQLPYTHSLPQKQFTPRSAGELNKPGNEQLREFAEYTSEFDQFSPYYMHQDAPVPTQNNSEVLNNSQTQVSEKDVKNSTKLQQGSASQSFVLLQHGPPGREQNRFSDSPMPFRDMIQRENSETVKLAQHLLNPLSFEALQEKGQQLKWLSEGMVTTLPGDLNYMQKLDESGFPLLSPTVDKPSQTKLPTEHSPSDQHLKPDVLQSFENQWKPLTPTTTSQKFPLHAPGKVYPLWNSMADQPVKGKNQAALKEHEKEE